jgi:hypothetical protein
MPPPLRLTKVIYPWVVYSVTYRLDSLSKKTNVERERGIQLPSTEMKNSYRLTTSICTATIVLCISPNNDPTENAYACCQLHKLFSIQKVSEWWEKRIRASKVRKMLGAGFDWCCSECLNKRMRDTRVWLRITRRRCCNQLSRCNFCFLFSRKCSISFVYSSPSSLEGE